MSTHVSQAQQNSGGSLWGITRSLEGGDDYSPKGYTKMPTSFALTQKTNVINFPDGVHNAIFSAICILSTFVDFWKVNVILFCYSE